VPVGLGFGVAVGLGDWGGHDGGGAHVVSGNGWAGEAGPVVTVGSGHVTIDAGVSAAPAGGAIVSATVSRPPAVSSPAPKASRLTLR
jgi:hypothetical protein